MKTMQSRTHSDSSQADCSTRAFTRAFTRRNELQEWARTATSAISTAKRRTDDSGSYDDDEEEEEEEELVGRRVVDRITPYLDYGPTRLPSEQER